MNKKINNNQILMLLEEDLASVVGGKKSKLSTANTVLSIILKTMAIALPIVVVVGLVVVYCKRNDIARWFTNKTTEASRMAVRGAIDEAEQRVEHAGRAAFNGMIGSLKGNVSEETWNALTDDNGKLDPAKVSRLVTTNISVIVDGVVQGAVKSAVESTVVNEEDRNRLKTPDGKYDVVAVVNYLSNKTVENAATSVFNALVDEASRNPHMKDSNGMPNITAAARYAIQSIVSTASHSAANSMDVFGDGIVRQVSKAANSMDVFGDGIVRQVSKTGVAVSNLIIPHKGMINKGLSAINTGPGAALANNFLRIISGPMIEAIKDCLRPITPDEKESALRQQQFELDLEERKLASKGVRLALEEKELAFEMAKKVSKKK